ncbi:MAG TPA: EAL domain-containing protein [Burkholderiales bacterium]|nr:EAL domain-containing protein [Burkholderiales bacterium]
MADTPIIRAPIDRLTAWYQPIVDLNTGEVRGFEALMRIVEPDGRVHSAGPLIETLEHDLDALVSVVERLFTCMREDVIPVFERHGDFYVSVNIPPSIIGTGRLRHITETLDLVHWGKRIVVELTERQALSDEGRAAVRLAREAGIAVAVDDFGTGHSGLAQIVGLELDLLKIDRSLITPALTSRSAARLLRGIVGLAESLRMRTVAEGVESIEEAFYLRAVGVDYGQGYFWSKAVPAAQMSQLLARGFAATLEWPGTN